MAKDPAFLFYHTDASADTQFMNRLERGCYFDLLKAQKMFGRFTLDQIKKVLGSDFETCWPSIKICLTFVEGVYFIAWVEESINKRKDFTESRRNNRKNAKKSENPIICQSYDQHMSNISSSYVEHMENEIEKEISKEEKGGVGEKEETQNPKTLNMPQDVFIVPEMLSIWKKENPKYLVQRDKDFPALMKLAEVIAEQSNVKATDAVGFKIVKDVWTGIVQFVAKDPFYKNFSLLQAERHIQGISAKISASNAEIQKSGNNASKQSTILTNADAAQKARQILQNKYAEV